MPADPLQDAVYLKVERTIVDNYRNTDGSYPVSPSAVATLASLAALAAIEEQGLVIVARQDLEETLEDAHTFNDVMLGGDDVATARLDRLRAALAAEGGDR